MRTHSVALLLLAALSSPSTSRAAEFPLSGYPCGEPGSGWLCYGGYLELVETTFESPDAEVSIVLDYPGGSDAWQVVNLHASFNGSASYQLHYSDSARSGWAFLREASFRDALGNAIVSSGRALMPICFQGTVDWTCFDGDNMHGAAQFGVVATSIHEPLQPDLPALNGPLSLRVDWETFGDAPATSSLRVWSMSFGYILAPIPEPGTALLLGLGLAGLAARRR